MDTKNWIKYSKDVCKSSEMIINPLTKICIYKNSAEAQKILKDPKLKEYISAYLSSLPPTFREANKTDDALMQYLKKLDKEDDELIQYLQELDIEKKDERLEKYEAFKAYFKTQTENCPDVDNNWKGVNLARNGPYKLPLGTINVKVSTKIDKNEIKMSELCNKILQKRASPHFLYTYDIAICSRKSGAQYSFITTEDLSANTVSMEHWLSRNLDDDIMKRFFFHIIYAIFTMQFLGKVKHNNLNTKNILLYRTSKANSYFTFTFQDKTWYIENDGIIPIIIDYSYATFDYSSEASETEDLADFCISIEDILRNNPYTSQVWDFFSSINPSEDTRQGKTPYNLLMKKFAEFTQKPSNFNSENCYNYSIGTKQSKISPYTSSEENAPLSRRTSSKISPKIPSSPEEYVYITDKAISPYTSSEENAPLPRRTSSKKTYDALYNTREENYKQIYTNYMLKYEDENNNCPSANLWYGLKIYKNNLMGKGNNGAVFRTFADEFPLVVKFSFDKDYEGEEGMYAETTRMLSYRISPHFLYEYKTEYCRNRRNCILDRGEVANERAENKGCLISAIELADYTLSNFFLDDDNELKPIDIKIFKQFMFHIIYGILAMQIVSNAIHNDLHSENVLVIKTPKEDKHYKFSILNKDKSLKTWYVDNLGFMPVITDFGYVEFDQDYLTYYEKPTRSSRKRDLEYFVLSLEENILQYSKEILPEVTSLLAELKMNNYNPYQILFKSNIFDEYSTMPKNYNQQIEGYYLNMIEPDELF